ncbi:hypothetical protein JYU34_005195 [Plutella xylostella]|uniref:Spondin-1 n=1 Tax=Plutella xylostella TaxID=51655 RepID=A0ABQ7QW29_PLUXY|nr:hypothetical protein JYU34_005195 [Plutella xylostella]
MKMIVRASMLLLLATSIVHTKRLEKCDQTPKLATVRTPTENNNLFKLTLVTKESRTHYLSDQTYVLLLKAMNETRPFRWFMITVEDPDVDNPYEVDDEKLAVDVGSLKTLDTGTQTRHSESCHNTVENADNTDKHQIEVHWVSPKHSDSDQRIRLRAMVAENEEVWYVGTNLTITLQKDINKPIDSPPLQASDECKLCSEARYEVIFQGVWSRATHPRHYPNKPDENGYSFMIGASHAYDYVLWEQGMNASKGLQRLAEEGDIDELQKEIISAISPSGGTRTLIRGKRRHHPDMSKPSHSLFRVDQIHHLFSIAVAMRPSPDWFLGTSRFELCNKTDWLKSAEIPLYPWDAGTVDGISYETPIPKTMTQPVRNVERVSVGSFDALSPFFQMNLRDLKPFAMLKVRRLDVFPHLDEDCDEEHQQQNAEEEAEEEGDNLEELSEPQVLGWSEGASCAQWGDWSPCLLDGGVCGVGNQVRFRENRGESLGEGYQELTSVDDHCPGVEETTQTRECYVPCS